MIKLKYIKIIFAIFIVCFYLNSYEILFYFKKKYYGSIANLPFETCSVIEKNKTYTYLRNDIIKKFNFYINYCLNNTNKFNYSLIKKPKISAIIPLFNGGKYLKYSLNSIQNQKMKEIEIILIDDCSKDDTLDIIKKYMEKDKRIKLIKNIENRKILFSKSMAALNANGKYIVQLDQDDMFLRDDLFNILYYEAEINNLDLVQMRELIISSYYIKNKTRVNCKGRHFIFKKNTYNISHFEEQPFLKDSLFKNGNVFLLWGMLIKTDIYKRAIYFLWPLIMNYQIIHYEDYTMTLIIIIFSKKYKYLNNFAILHIKNRKSATFKYRKELIKSILFLGNNIYNYHIKNNPLDIRIGINFVNRYLYKYKLSKKYYYNFFSYNIRNIINNQYISNEEKSSIINRLNINKKWSSYEYFMNSSEYFTIYNFQNIRIESFNKQLYDIINPKITIIIVFFEIQYLKTTINSILNQESITFEIILINGNVSNNNFDVIKKYIEEYKNIKLLSNENEVGILFLYYKGVLQSKGEFILVIESGETLAKKSTLSYMYNKTINNNIDVLEFDLLINDSKELKKNSLRLYQCKHLRSKISLESFKYNKNYREIDQEKELLTGKLINTKFFKKNINKYNINKYNFTIHNYYNEILLFIIFKEKIKFIHINEFGIILWTHNIYKYYETNINNNKQKINDSIFYINFLFDNTEYKRKELVLYEFYDILSIIYNRYNRITKQSTKLYKKFLNCKYITELEKKKIIFLINSLLK